MTIATPGDLTVAGLAPHEPSARPAGSGWRAVCAHCALLDDVPLWLVHDDREEATDEALSLLIEHLHGPIDLTQGA